MTKPSRPRDASAARWGGDEHEGRDGGDGRDEATSADERQEVGVPE